MSNRITAKLVTDALEISMWKRRPQAGLLVHSDRGSQYVSERYQSLLNDNEFVCSMSRNGNYRDNAVAGSFFHTLKTELIHHEGFQAREEAHQAIFEYIEVFCFITIRESTRAMATWHRSSINKNLPGQRKKVSGKSLPYQVMGYRQFLVRGLEAVSAEWDLLCISFNLKKMFSLMLKDLQESIIFIQLLTAYRVLVAMFWIFEQEKLTVKTARVNPDGA